MIDLICLKIAINHEPFGSARHIFKDQDKVPKKDNGKDQQKIKYLSKKVQLYPGAAFIEVTSIDEGTKIIVRCCPLKPLQGHNIFGTDYVKGLGYKLICYVLDALKIPASLAQKRAWKRGEFELQELHVTYRFGVPSHRVVGKILAHLLRNVSLSLRPAAMEQGAGIRLLAPHRLAEWALYDKRLEFEDKRRKEDKYIKALVGARHKADAITERLREAATNSLRVELRLNYRYLDKHALNTGAAWRRSAPREVFLKELALLRLGAVPSLEYATALLDQVSDPKLRQTLFLWLHGEDLSFYHLNSTLKTRRKEIEAATGIDIKLDLVPTKLPPVPIADIFDEANMLPNFPAWTDRHPTVAYKGQSLPVPS